MEHTVHLRPETERLAGAIAEACERDELGSLGHLPNVLRDALALGLEQLGRRHGVLGPELPPRSAPPTVLAERAAAAQLRLPDGAVTTVAVLHPACVELRTDAGDALIIQRDGVSSSSSTQRAHGTRSWRTDSRSSRSCSSRQGRVTLEAAQSGRHRNVAVRE